VIFFVGVALIATISLSHQRSPYLIFVAHENSDFIRNLKHRQDVDDKAQPNPALLLLVFFVGEALITTFPLS
jgi:hypothetical protein